LDTLITIRSLDIKDAASFIRALDELSEKDLTCLGKKLGELLRASDESMEVIKKAMTSE
jgi:hypothetical protein